MAQNSKRFEIIKHLKESQKTINLQNNVQYIRHYLVLCYNKAMKNKVTFGEKIKNKRLQLNLSMDFVAQKAGITRSTLWAIENGSGNYTIDALFSVLNCLKISINLNGNEECNRKRATRTNSSLDKKINRFIVMCIEQYALNTNQSSGLVYKKLSKAGIIKELKDDYEDMHGMSTYSINEYIGKRLAGGAL